jgi:hypothetical protein
LSQPRARVLLLDQVDSFVDRDTGLAPRIGADRFDLVTFNAPCALM